MPIEPVLKPLLLSDGRTVLSYEGTFYRVLLVDEVTVHALPARTVATPEDAEADLVSLPPSADPAPVTAVLDRTRFIIAARRVLGLVDPGVRALIAQLPAGEAQATALDLWENSSEFHRDNTVLIGLAALGGYTAAQLDDVFRAGAAPDLY